MKSPNTWASESVSLPTLRVFLLTAALRNALLAADMEEDLAALLSRIEILFEGEGVFRIRVEASHPEIDSEVLTMLFEQLGEDDD